MAIVWNDPANETAYNNAIALRDGCFTTADAECANRISALEEDPPNQVLELACRALQKTAAEEALDHSQTAAQAIITDGIKADNRGVLKQEFAQQEKLRIAIGKLKPTGQ